MEERSYRTEIEEEEEVEEGSWELKEEETCPPSTP